MNTTPPRLSDGAFQQIHHIYYGTDDGFAELRPREEARHDAAHKDGLYKIFSRYQEFHRHHAPVRCNNIHLVSVVGGLYGLNLIPIFQPNEITFFDINIHAVVFFNIIRRVWIGSKSANQFLHKLTQADYEVDTEQDHIIRKCIAARQNRTLTDDCGQSARSLLSSWRYALDHFELTRKILSEVPVHARLEDMQSQSFCNFVAQNKNLWLYCSNVMLFSFFDLHFNHPQNAALFASYFDKTDMLYLGNYGDDQVTVHCRLPMSVSN